VPFFLGRQCSRSDALLRSVLGWILAIGALYSVICLILYLQGKVGEFGEGRFANFGSPIGIAQNCGITIVVCIAYLFGTTWFRRALLILVSVAAFFILLATASRGPFLATAIGAMAVLLVYRRLSGKVSALVIGAFCMLVLFIVLAPDQALRRLNESFSAQSLTTVSTGRLSIYGLALRHATDSPIFGLGTAGFSALEGNYKTVSYPHNMFLEVLIEYGLVGLAVFLPLLTVMAVRLVGFVRNHRHEPLLGRAYLAMIIVAFQVAQTSEHLGQLSVFWFICGILSNSAITRPATGEEPIATPGYPDAYPDYDRSIYTPTVTR
jgi:O-antigen ligase